MTVTTMMMPKNVCDGEVCSHSLRPPDWGILASSQLQLASTQSYSPSGIRRPSSSLPTSSTALNTFLCPQPIQFRHQRQNLTNKKKSPGQPQSTATLLIFAIKISNQKIQRNKYQRSSSSSAGPSH